jgi:uncharacterized protein
LTDLGLRPPIPVSRAVLGILAFFLLGFFLLVLVVIPFAPIVVGKATLEELARRPTVGLLLLQGVGLLAAFGLATWVVARWLHLDRRELRWRAPLKWTRGLAGGLALGVLPAAAAMLLGIIVGEAAWVPDQGSLLEYTSRLGFLLVLLAPAALAEEVIFRGVPLVLLSRVLGRPAAIVVLSVAFALVHAKNPDVTSLALGNIALAGILLSLAFYSLGGMWAAFGAHLGWNGTLAALGAEVSGLPFEIPLIDYKIGGPEWLTGGPFGPEGGLVGTLTITLAIVVAAQWVRREPA